MEFELPKENSQSIIKVMGVGGGGSNAVNYMFNKGIDGVNFVICNTDSQALDISPIPLKVQLGSSLTEGRGAGSIPEVGKNAAIENIEEIRQILESNTKMIFVTAGMGGGTGTGAAPIIAETAKELGILTVGIVTSPFQFEGKRRRKQAEEGIEEMKKHVDTLLVINNDKLREMYGNLSMGEAFAQADNILTTAARGIAEIIMRTGYVNVDFEDVRTVMTDGGVAIMGSGEATGENRAIEAIEKALTSPLLNNNKIVGAKYVLLNLSFGAKELLMDEIADITDYIQDEAGDDANVIWGYGKDDRLDESISVTLIATGFDSNNQIVTTVKKSEKPKVHVLEIEEQKQAEAKKEEESNNVPQIKTEAPKQEEITFSSKSEDKTEEEEAEFNEPVLIKRPTPAFQKIEEEPQLIKREVDPNQEEERSKRTFDRISRLKDLSRILRTPSGIQDLENEPAYKRKKIRLEDTPHSSDSQVSRYTLTETENENGERKTEIRSNNSFLHDNVD